MVNTFISFISVALNNGRKIRSLLAIVMLMLVSVSVTAAQINVSVDRNPISFSDSFQLTFTATESPDDDPDFSPLKQDFDIINQQKNSQLSWVNGSTTKTIQWTLNVMAKRFGDLEIPAIAFGDDASTPLSITVIETTPLTAISNDDELYLEVDASPTNAYVQAQVLYTVRLYQRINLAQATLSDPHLDNAIVEKLGEDSQYNTNVKGVTYLVTERKYALFPQQSGTMTIAPLVLTADVITHDPRSRFDSFFSNQRTQTKRVLSKAITLNVQPAPADFNANHWLPAEQLELKETWSNSDLNVKVGEPITRTLTIIAKGATASQLPDLTSVELNPQLKIYPDKPVINDQNHTNSIIAIREQKMAFIPSSAGAFSLPAIEIPWFNTRTQKMETAQLPAVRLTAVAAEPSIVTSATPTNQVEKIDTTEPNLESSLPLSENMATGINTLWIWTTLGFALAWLTTLVFLMKARVTNRFKESEIAANSSPTKLKDIINALKKACTDNDPQGAHKALIKWATVTYNTASLSELSDICDSQLQTELIQLNRALYAKEKVAWDGAKLLQVVSAANQTMQTKTQVSAEPLKPLYPSQS